MMTRIEAIELLKDHEYWTDFSWMDEVAEMAIEALEKQIPKKPNEYYDGYADGNPVIEFECPNCGAELDADFDHHCRCGQAIDWSEEVKV